MTQKLQQPDHPDWMVVYMTNDHTDAHIIAGRLQHEGIPHYVHSQPGMSAMGITIGMMGAIQVLVKPEDYDDALDILFPNDDDDAPELPGADVYIDELDDE